MSVLHEILELPSEVKKGDYVVRLTDGVANPASLLERYAITADLVRAFDRALGLIGAALKERRSQAAYVHGSFGSGKSQFMGVLSLLTSGHEGAWRTPELHALWDKHEKVRTAKLLRLHFHMVGARSIEEKVFGQYVATVQARHPDAPLPALFRDGPLFDSAQQVRAALGDGAFFAKLNEGRAVSDGWGDLAAAGVWDAPAFDSARASCDPEERARLFNDLVRTGFFRGYTQGGAWVGFDEGLGVLSRHAASLGYDGVVLFLDELVLWLAARASEVEWLNAEGQKIAKLVEAQDDHREIPIVSFAARQRDLIDLVGDQLAGAEARNLRDSLKWWEGRFDVLKLEDRDLPAIVEKKVIVPKGEMGKAALNTGFEQARRKLGEAFGSLQGEIGSPDTNAFRRVYPFSPALVDVLVGISNGLQRERTAIKVLAELLVEHLEDFQLGQVVSVGNLYDVLAGGDNPLDGAMKASFHSARRIYEGELLPAIHEVNGTGTPEKCQRLRKDHPVSLGCSNCPAAACRADNRFVKTLLLAALIPRHPVLKDLTATRLYRLNFGALRSPVPGREAADAVVRLRRYASQVGKLRLSEGAGDPTASIVLDAVDLKPILEKAQQCDTPAARRQKVRELLFLEMGLDAREQQPRWDCEWRNIRRRGSIVFGNVREMAEPTLRTPDDDDFRVVIDFPFDHAGFGPADDAAALEAFRDRASTPTVAWLPHFFSERVQRQLGELVVLDRLAEGDWKQHTEHLRDDDRARAKQEIEALAGSKRQQVLRAMRAAYGLANADDGELDAARRAPSHFVALLPDLDVRLPGATTFEHGVTGAVEQVLSDRHPQHPMFEQKVTAGRLEKALDLFRRLCEADGQRLQLDRGEDDDLGLAGALNLVTVHAGVATLKTQPFEDVERALRGEGADAPTASRVAHHFDPAAVRGLTRDLKDFLVLAFAEARHRLLLDFGGRPIPDPRIGKLSGEEVLAEVERPSEQEWEVALSRAGALFGVAVGGRANTPRNLAKFAQLVIDKRAKAIEGRAAEVAPVLASHSTFVKDSAPRLQTARAAAELLALLSGSQPRELAEALARFTPRTSVEAMRAHFVSAADTARVLSAELVFGAFERLDVAAHPEAAAVLTEVRRVLEADALHESLETSLNALARRAQELLAPRPVIVPPKRTEPSPPPPPLASGSAEGLDGLEREKGKMSEALRNAGPGAKLVVEWRIVRK